MRYDTKGRLLQGETPLIIAAHAGHITVVKILLANGANPSVKDGSKRTALLHAKVRRSGARCWRARCVPTACLNSVRCGTGPEALQYHGPARGGGGSSSECGGILFCVMGPSVGEQCGAHLAAGSHWWRRAKQPAFLLHCRLAGEPLGLPRAKHARKGAARLPRRPQPGFSRHHVFAVKFRACVGSARLCSNAVSKVSKERISFTNFCLLMTATHAIHHPSL